jgi:ParB-like chromosome segregation protein Spo0J
MTAQLKIVYKKTDDLIPYARNSRTHDDAQVAQIAASIKEFGWTNPILLDGENGIIAGHGRVMAAQKLGENKVPTIELAHMTDIQKRAYIIADNKLALNAGWDIKMLKLEFEDLQAFDFDATLTGFDIKSIESILSQDEKELGLLPEEKLDNFLNGDTKILRLAYDEQEFETIVSSLQELAEKLGFEDFSSIVFALVREKCEQ